MTPAQKRPLYDSTQVVTEIPGRHQKRLRLTLKKSGGSILALINRLEGCSTSNEALELLCEVSEGYDESELPDAIRKLLEHYRKDQESTVRIKILSIIGDLVIESSFDTTGLVEELLLLLKVEHSAKVLSRALGVLRRIGRFCPVSTLQLQKIIGHAQTQLLSSSHNVQRQALSLLGSLRSSEVDCLELIAKYTDSADGRVRAQAFASMLTLGEQGVPLTPELYQRAVAALKDDYECVRREALLLVHAIGVAHAEHMVLVPGSEQEIRLVDDAFGKVCIALCDISMDIRTHAAQLLGTMTAVSDEFLHQTLDKKLMSNMRRKRSLHERAYEHFTSGEWSSGKKWADDAPKELVSADSVSLLSSGACGAFVQGLEDEFLEVRTAAVESVCKLAMNNAPFARTCLDFLVDMFNDEIEEVRLKAIYSLTAISRHIELREDQLETMLGALEDYSVEVREGLHLMLGACKVSTHTCLMMVLQKVLDVLSKYPQDKLSAYGCLERVGQRHPDICHVLVPKLLQIHPFFDNPEPDVEDPSYICVLILLFNAAKHCGPICSFFNETTLRHYAYLRDTMPVFVPHLETIATKPEEAKPTNEETGSRQFLETLLSKIKSSYAAPRARQALLQAAQDNLHRLAFIDTSLSGTANFTAEFLGAQLIIEQLHTNVLSTHSRTPSRDCLNQLIKKCLKLQNLFSGLAPEDLLLVKQICLRASALQLVLIVKDKSQSALAPCQLLLHIAASTSAFLADNPAVAPDAFTTSILDQLAGINDPKPGRVFREILPIVQAATPVATPRINTDIRMCVATITEPADGASTENAIKVTAGLVAALPLVVEIENLQPDQQQNLRIRVKYPDQNTHVVVPRLRDLKRVMTETGEEAENRWRLRSQVLLSHGVWTEACQVEISLCLFVRPGHELELGKPVKATLFPKPVKRGG